MSRPEFRPDDSSHDPDCALEQYLLAGFPPDLALDLVLNELVARAADATHASSAALALARGGEMVCRAASGYLAPNLGTPLNTRDGLSGACFQTRQPQLSADTESDSRLDPAVSRRLGIRSILIVPIFATYDNATHDNDTHDNATHDNDANHQDAPLAGLLEVFSPAPAAFSSSDQKLLQAFAEECARIRQAVAGLRQRQPATVLPQIFPSVQAPSELVPSDSMPPDFIAASPPPASPPSYQAWTLALGVLTILATIALSFLIGSRIEWLRSSTTPSTSQVRQPIEAEKSAPAKSCVGTAAPGCPAGPSEAATAPAHRGNPALSARASKKLPETNSDRAPKPVSNPPAQDELVVYEKGKVIYRMKPAPAQPDGAQNVGATSAQTTNAQTVNAPAKHNHAQSDSTGPVSDSLVKASSITKLAPLQPVWLSPERAENRLLSRTEPQYPPEARAAHRSGNVVLEVQVAEDGSVSNIRTLSGDPVLAAAATSAVRAWRYQPYRQHDHPSPFQTDVTLTFTLPD
jgi:TonB family protein